MYKLVATDMDGTLLNGDSKITERTKAAIFAALERGALFVVSTGRPMCGVEHVNALFKEDLPFIVYNGAMVVTGKTKKVLFSKFLNIEDAGEIFDFAAKMGFALILWAKGVLYANVDDEKTQAYKRISGISFKVIDDLSGISEINKIVWLISPEDAARYQRIMGERLGARVNCHESSPGLLEFVDALASKGAALREIGETYGISPDEMIAIGDGYNDISMLRFAGLSVAMENAPPEVKAAARLIARSNNDDGAARIIEKYILKG